MHNSQVIKSFNLESDAISRKKKNEIQPKEQKTTEEFKENP